MKSKKNEFKDRVILLMNYDSLKTSKENLKEHSMGMPFHTPEDYTPLEEIPYEERLEDWKSKYIELGIPYPSVLYGEKNSIIIPRNQGRYKVKTDVEWANIKIQDGEKIKVYQQLSTFATGHLYGFVTPDGIFFVPWFRLEGNTVKFYGYCKREGGKCYRESDYAEDMPQKVDSKRNLHLLLDIVEVCAFVFSLFTAGTTAIIWATTSAIAGLTNAGLYFREGQNYTGTLYVIFGLLGAGGLVKGGMKVYSKYIPQEIADAMLKYEKGVAMTAKEAKIVEETLQELAVHGAKLSLMVTRRATQMMMEDILKRFGPKAMMKQAALFGLGTVTILGAEYGFGEAWMALFGDEDEIKENSPARALWRKLRPNGEKEVAAETWKKIIEDLKNKTAELNAKKTEKDPKQVQNLELFSYKKNPRLADSLVNEFTASHKNPNYRKKIPTYDQVLSGAINPKTKKPFRYEFGDKEDGIKKIKENLSKLGYSKEFRNLNNVFDDDLASVLISFLETENIGTFEEIGTYIDSKILKLIEEKLKK